VTLCKYKGPEPARSDAEAARTPGDGCARFLVRTCVRPLGEAHDASHYSMVPQAIITHYSMVPQAIITPRNSRQPQALELGTCCSTGSSSLSARSSQNDSIAAPVKPLIIEAMR